MSDGHSFPPGWYPDPEVAGQSRYWDGSRWTEHRHMRAGTPGGALSRSLAPYLARVSGYLLDVIVSLLIVGVVLVVLALVGSALGGSSTGAGGTIGFEVLFVGGFVLVQLVQPLCMSRSGKRNGQTIGSQLVGIRVVRNNGLPMTFGAAFVRQCLVRYLLFDVLGGFLFSIPTLLNYLWPLWDDENRALHDMIVKTHVLRATS